MSDNSLKKIKILWEKFDNHKPDNEKNQNQNSFVNDIRYTSNKKWVSPEFGILPNENHNSKTSKLFSMAYNEEEKINRSYPNVNLFISTFSFSSHSIKYFVKQFK